MVSFFNNGKLYVNDLGTYTIRTQTNEEKKFMVYFFLYLTCSQTHFVVQLYLCNVIAMKWRYMITWMAKTLTIQ